MSSQLVGTFPAFLGEIQDLRYLTLWGDISGTIPSTITKLRKLRNLHLETRLITGSFPNGVIQSLESLKELTLGLPSLTGQIPDEFGANGPDLRRIEINGCNITGPIPESIYNMPSLERL